MPANNMTDKKCKSTRYVTPSVIMDPVRKYLGGFIAMDPATEENNPQDADVFYTAETNGLDKPWSKAGTFLNPPYGKVLQDWTKKLRTEVVDRDIPLVALLPGQRFETAYWQENVLNEALDFIVFIRRRVSFLRPDGQKAVGNPYGSMLYLYNSKELAGVAFRHAFVKDCFHKLGKIIVYNEL